MDDIIKRGTAAEIALAYTTATDEIRQAFRLLKSAKARLLAVNGRHRDAVFDAQFRGSGFDFDRDADDAVKTVRRNTWRSILDRFQVWTLVSEKRRDELTRELDADTFPDPTEEAMFSFLESLRERIPDLLRETVLEAFEFLRPHTAKWKTNPRFELSKKAIIPGVIDASFGMTRLNHYREQELRSVDNAFHLLDGRGPIEYPDDLATKISAEIHARQWECESKYFRCRWYKAGTLHIEFRRPDLVAKLNALAGGKTIKVG